MDPDNFRTLSGRGEGLYKEKGSRFVSVAVPVSNVDEALGVVHQARLAHPKARHHCFAYRLGFDGLLFRFNDDGEPGGTGGKPILGQIDALGLTDVAVVVSRYFGGTLLGAQGLAQAYRLSAAEALAAGKVELKERKKYYRLDFSYDILGRLMETISKQAIQIEARDFGLEPHLIVSMPFSHDPESLDRLIAGALGCFAGEIKGRRIFGTLKVSENLGLEPN